MFVEYIQLKEVMMTMVLVALVSRNFIQPPLGMAAKRLGVVNCTKPYFDR
jgi:hypothetical protein